jgi:hypothetical protein
MTRTGWIILGSVLGAGALTTAIVLIVRNRRGAEVTQAFEEETERKKDELGVSDGSANNPFLGDLIEKIWIMDNTSKYAPQGTEGREAFMERSRNLNRALQHKGLTYWRDDNTHNLDKGGVTVATLPRT